MGNIIKKMANKVPEAFFGFYIFLPTYLAIFTVNNCIAVKAVFCCSFFKMRQGNWLFILLKKQRNGMGYIQKNHLASSCEYPFNFEPN
jgi:hypothetical protein